MELPVTSAIDTDLDMEELTWDDRDVFIAKEEERTPSLSLSSCELQGSAKSHTSANIVTSLLDEIVSSVVIRAPPIAKSASKVEESDKVEASTKMEDQWVDNLVTAINDLEAKYTPHPLPYEDPPGEIHSADVRPPQVDFTALGFTSRFLPKPDPLPVYGCSEDPAFYRCERQHHKEGTPPPCSDHVFHCSNPGRAKSPDFPGLPWHVGPRHGQPDPFGTLPGLLTDSGVIAMPSALFGHTYVSGTGRDTLWAMQAC